MSLSQGQVNELLRIVSQYGEGFNYIVSELLKNKVNENYVVSYIRRGLVDSKQYEGTIKLLCSIVLNFSKEVLQDHLVSLMDTVLSNRNEGGEKFRFLNTAVKYCHSNEHVNKSKVLVLISKIVEKCIAVNKYTSYETESLSCLAACLEFYSSTCGPFRSKLENHLLGYISYDKVGSSAIGQAAKCYHYLQQCGPAGVDSINHVQNWTNALIKICLTIKELLECVKDANSVLHDSRDGVVLLPLALDTNTDARVFITKFTLLNLLAYLAALIEFRYTCAKVFKPQLIIDLLECCLSKHRPSNDSIESFCTNSVQISIEIQFLKVFWSFIATMKMNIIPFSDSIMKTLIDRLRETKGDELKYNSEYQEELYNVISFFIKTTRNNVSARYHKKLLTIIMNDIKPTTENITLTAPDPSASTKVKRTITQSQTTSSSVGKDNWCPNDVSIREKICCAALDCLIECFKTLAVNVKYTMLKDIYKNLCITLGSIQEEVSTPPYISHVSTCKLYEAIVAALEQVHPPPLPVVLNLLLVGQSNGNSEVSSVCTSGIMSIEKICQPVRPLVFSTLSSKAYVGDNEDELVHFDDNGGSAETTENADVPFQLDVVEQNYVQEEIEVEDNDVYETVLVSSSSVRSESPPVKISRQATGWNTDDIGLEDMLLSFKDLPTSRKK